MEHDTMTAGCEPEAQASTRREALAGLGRLGMGIAAASLPVAAVAALARPARAQASSVPAALNLALTLEYLEAALYTQGLASGVIPAADQAIFTALGNHEAAHVKFLEQQLGSQAIDEPTFDFTGGNGSGNGPFSPFEDYDDFLVLAQGFEDLGVRAYKGQLPALMGSDTLVTVAMTIHAVEGRHASMVRRLRGERAGQKEQAPYKGWPTLSQVDAAAAAFQAVYNAGTPATDNPAESNVTQNGVTISGLSGQTAASASEAFDEPLDAATVRAIVGPFIAG
jgi:hypothetical protein